MAVKTHTVTLTVEVEVEVRRTRIDRSLPSIEEVMEAWMQYGTQLLSGKAMAEEGFVDPNVSVIPVITAWKVEEARQ